LRFAELKLICILLNLDRAEECVRSALLEGGEPNLIVAKLAAARSGGRDLEAQRLAESSHGKTPCSDSATAMPDHAALQRVLEDQHSVPARYGRGALKPGEQPREGARQFPPH